MAFGWLVAATAAAEPLGSTPAALVNVTARGDAALADVCFIDRSNGWAVGDRGVIWHSPDGGVTWQQQDSQVSSRLNSVYFIDPQHGWAVGGAGRPHSKATIGVVLRTNDGGQTWINVPQLMLPRLARIKLFSETSGIAVGEGSSLSPSGVFVTRDAGRTWQPLPTDQAGSWLAGDFLNADTGAVAGFGGRIATIARRQVVHSPLAGPTARALRAMTLVSPAGGWIVGDGGLVMTTGDAGRSWQAPPTDLPSDVFGHFDFHAVAVRGTKVWIAGSPGTRVFHSPDGGTTWLAQMTGQTAPLRGLSFVDDSHGWAVGELGSILATQDGGRTWKLQRAGGRRAALLAVFAQASDVPLELLAAECAAEGYLTAVEILHPQSDGDSATVATPSNAARTREAMILAGATAADSAWRFPVPAANLALGPAELLDALNRANDGRALEQLELHLVRKLRTWRPDVIVTHHSRLESSRPVDALVEQLVLRSIAAGADPTRYVELATDAGLSAWPVKKAYGVLPPGSRGDEVIATGRFAARLGSSLADWSAPARQLLATSVESPAPLAGTVELELLLDQTASNEGPRGLFSGVALAPGSEARRAGPNDVVGDIEELRQLAARQRQLRQLIERSDGNAAWMAQLDQMLQGMDVSRGGELLFQLATEYRNGGRLDLAADTYFLLARRYPDHSLADPALVWLVQYYASGELARRANERQLVDVRHAATNDSAKRDGVVQAGAEAPVGADVEPVVGLSRDDRLRRAAQLGKYLESSRPQLYAEPAVRYPLVAAERELGFANPARRFFLTLRKLPASDPWRRCAETEEWLAKPGESPPPKLLGHCRLAPMRPHLDGMLDEPFWDAADQLRLKGEGADEAELLLAYDQQYLYLGVKCPKAPGIVYGADEQPRPRDADLSEHDRMSLRLDVDRDYATWFELVVDDRGWIRDACWGDSKWNPSWFVAAAGDRAAWTVEAAVPIRELAAEPPDSRHVWAAAIRRTIPRVGYQSWSGDAHSTDSPDEFGLLIFE
jgi:photosystem II stability/assembly factor-like uncharacterized protein